MSCHYQQFLLPLGVSCLIIFKDSLKQRVCLDRNISSGFTKPGPLLPQPAGDKEPASRMQTKIKEGWDRGKEGKSPEACQNWCLHFDNIQAEACEIRPYQCSQLSCGWLGSDDTMPRILSLCSHTRDGSRDKSWASRNRMTAEFPKRVSQVWGKSPRAGLMAHYSSIFIYKASLLDLECVLMARGACLIRQWMWKKLAKDPQGALQLSPANISSSRLMFLPLWGPEGSWALIASYRPCACVGRPLKVSIPAAATGLPSPFSSKGSSPTSSSFAVASFSSVDIYLPGHPGMPPTPWGVAIRWEGWAWSQGQVTSSAGPQNKHCQLPHLLPPMQLSSLRSCLVALPFPALCCCSFPTRTTGGNYLHSRPRPGTPGSLSTWLTDVDKCSGGLDNLPTPNEGISGYWQQPCRKIYPLDKYLINFPPLTSAIWEPPEQSVAVISLPKGAD